MPGKYFLLKSVDTATVIWQADCLKQLIKQTGALQGKAAAVEVVNTAADPER